MRTKRNLILLAAALVLGVAVWGVVGAQDATPTAPDTEAITSARPFLGVLLEESDQGVVISEVTDGSAAADAGLQAGDVITAVNGDEVASVSDVSAAIKALAVGDEVTIDVTRDGETVSVTATLGSQPESDFNLPGLPFGRGNRGTLHFGDIGIEYDADAQTWTVTALSEDSALYEAGLREGDVITGIDGEAYDLPSLLPYLMSLEDDATVTLNVERDGEAQDIEMPASDLTGLFAPGGFNFGFDRSNLPREFRSLVPSIQSALASGWLGVSFETLDADVAAANDLSVTDGALINAVAEESPAAQAGVQAGDVITAVNGEAVDAEHTLRDRMIAYESGDVVTLSVLRNGDTIELDVTLAEPQMGDLRGMLEGMLPFNFGGRNGDGRFHFELPAPEQAAPEAAPATNL